MLFHVPVSPPRRRAQRQLRFGAGGAGTAGDAGGLRAEPPRLRDGTFPGALLPRSFFPLSSSHSKPDCAGLKPRHKLSKLRRKKKKERRMAVGQFAPYTVFWSFPRTAERHRPSLPGVARNECAAVRSVPRSPPHPSASPGSDFILALGASEKEP